jgi:hypothetical protein
MLRKGGIPLGEALYIIFKITELLEKIENWYHTFQRCFTIQMKVKTISFPF